MCLESGAPQRRPGRKDKDGPTSSSLPCIVLAQTKQRTTSRTNKQAFVNLIERQLTVISP